MNLHLMHDIETLSGERNAYILSIGALVVDLDENVFKQESTFYVTIAGKQEGRHVDPRTVTWWMEQDDEVRADTFKGGNTLKQALTSYRDFLKQFKIEGVWSNGADFDNVILMDAYKQCHIELPWQYRQSRCMRTLYNFHKSEYPLPTLPEHRKGHNALADACRQAYHLHMLWPKHAK
jgi:exodeoxyribonuclease VIII